MRDNIESLIYDIIVNNSPEDSAKVLSGIIYDVDNDNSIEDSIYKNCDIILS